MVRKVKNVNLGPNPRQYGLSNKTNRAIESHRKYAARNQIGGSRRNRIESNVRSE